MDTPEFPKIKFNFDNFDFSDEEAEMVDCLGKRIMVECERSLNKIKK